MAVLMREWTLPVADVFGPVWQGEGPHAGLRCSFLRLGLCNLHCEWCDTAYTWDRDRFDVQAECPPRDAAWIRGELAGHGTDRLVLTGGEPLIHRRNEALLDVLTWWRAAGRTVDVETNGTLPPPAWHQWIDLAAVSPKLGQSADAYDRRIRPDVLAEWAGLPQAVLKVVCRDGTDVADLARKLHTWGDWSPDRVWVMPEGDSASDVLDTAREIEESVTDCGFNLTLRMHTLIYGKERGR
jgi:organic radical activating enzyme